LNLNCPSCVERSVRTCILTNFVLFMHSAHFMLTLLSCSARARLVEGSVTSMRTFPASFNLAWHDVISLMSYGDQTTSIMIGYCSLQSLGFLTSLVKAGPMESKSNLFEFFVDIIGGERLPVSPQEETVRVKVSSGPAMSGGTSGTGCKFPKQTALSPSSLSRPSRPVWPAQLHFLLPSPDE